MKKILLLFSFAIPKILSAQIGMPDNEQYENLRNNTLYVEFSNRGDYTDTAMKAAISAVWNVSKIEFKDPYEIKKLYSPGNFFVTLEHDTRSFSFFRERKVGDVVRWENSAPVNNDYFYLHFWAVDKDYNSSKQMSSKFKNTIARAELYLQSIGTGKIENLSTNLGSPTFQREFCNGLPGYIKCVFLAVNNNVRDNIITNLKKDIDASPEIVQLRKDTLYVPNYWFGPGGTMLPDEPENSANGKYINKLLNNYSYPVKLVRRDVLSNMLLTASKPVYFFNYVQSSADKMISIVNGQTGNVLYYNFNGKSYRPKPDDFSDLSKIVERGQ